MNKFLKLAQDYAKSHNGSLMTVEYVDAKTKMQWKCQNENHPSWMISWDTIKRNNSWCSACRLENLRKENGSTFLKKAQDYAKSHNGSLITTEYVNAKTKMEWKCSNPEHSTFFLDLDKATSKNRWCKSCAVHSPEWTENKQKAIDIAKSHGGLVIFPKDIEHIKTNTVLTFKCSNHEHKPWKTMFRNVSEFETWCPECAGRFTPQEFVQKAHKFAQDNGGVCLTNTYENQNSRFKFKCSIPDHDEFEGTYSMIQSNVWCKECKKTSESVLAYKASRLQEAKDFAKTRGGECLSTEFIAAEEYLIWKCHEKNHNPWKSKFTNTVGSNQRWCPECAGQLPPDKLLIKAQNYANKHNGKVLSQDIQLATQKVEWKCENNAHPSWKVSLTSVTTQNTWCPQCGYENYYMENSVRIILQTLLGIEFSKSRPSWNINPLTQQTLELDGYNEEHKIAFEFQGRHHFKQLFKKQNLQDIQFKDKQKIINCKNNGVKLLIISQEKKMYKLNVCLDIIQNYLTSIGISFEPITDIEKLEKKIFQLTRNKEKDKKLQIAKDHASSKNGECLSDTYLNYSHHMKWKCSKPEHQPWLATYSSVIRNNSWCPECAHKKPKFIS